MISGLGINAASYERIRGMAERGELSLRVMYTLWGGMQIRTPDAAKQFVTKIRETRPFQGNEWLYSTGII